MRVRPAIPSDRDAPARRVTLADIARACRLSRPTVSLALNHGHGHCEIAAATCEHIQRTASAMGYVPRWQHHARVRSTSRLFALVLRPVGFFNPFNVRVLEGFCTEAARQGRGTALVLATSGDRGLAERLAAGRFDGAVLANGASRAVLQAVDGAGLRTVLLNAADLDGAFLVGRDHVTIDDVQVLAQACAHLEAFGHRRLAYLGRPRQRVMHGSEALRQRAFTERTGGTGLVVDEADALLRRLRSAASPPTGVVCYNDAVAQRLLQACQAADIRVPERLSVVGIDDNPSSAWAVPPLTCVAIPAEELGRAAARLAAQPADAQPRHLRLAGRLVVRGSTAAPCA